MDNLGNMVNEKVDKESKNKLFWANLTYLIIITLFIIWRLIYSTGLFENLTGFFSDYLFSLVTQIFILLLIPMTIYLFILKKKPKKLMQDFGFRKVSFKTILLSILFGFLAYYIIIFVSTFFSGIISLFGYEKPVTLTTSDETYGSFGAFLLGILMVAVLPGIFEEFVHRGMLLRGYQKLGAKRAIIFSGLLFGLMHVNINQFFYAFVIGMIFAIIALATKSIFPSMIIHFMNNGLNVYQTYASENNWFGQNLGDWINLSFLDSNIALKFIVYVIVLLLIVVLSGIVILKMFIIEKNRQFNVYAKKVALDENGELHDEETIKSLIKIFWQADTTGKIDFDENDANKNSQINEPNISINNRKKELNYYNILFPPRQEDKYKPSFKENIFLYLAIFIGGVGTLFTFIWGLL